MPCKRPTTVVVTNWVSADVLEKLKGHFEVIANAQREPWPENIRLKNFRQADAVIAFMNDRIDDITLADCPHLKLIACALKGYDNVDIGACTRRGIRVTIAEHLLTVPTAELTIGLMICVGRNILPGDTLVRSGNFAGWRPHLYGVGLSGRVIGMLGMGAIGMAVSSRLQGFGVKQLYWDRKRLAPEVERDLELTWADKDALAVQSDFVILGLSLSPETRHLVDRHFLSRMKPNAFLINLARGSLVAEEAVAAALAADQLRGYAADVFAFEDWLQIDRPSSIPRGLLEARDKTVFTPHLGSAVDEIRLAVAMEAADTVIDFFSVADRPRCTNT
jgi:phosphonate dehydrogenase